MTEKQPQMSLSRLLPLIIGAAFAVVSIVVVLAVDSGMRQQALVEAEAKARIILDRNLATDSYFSQMLRPKVFELTDPFRKPDYFEPSWMSSTYAVREIDKLFKTLTDADYYYKEAAVNARSPQNEADAYEKAILAEMAANPKLSVRSEVRMLDGKPYFVVLRRGEVMEQSCLSCHSSPDDAPQGLVRQYGPERSFHRKVGELVDTISIRIPLAAAYAEADGLSRRLSALLLGGLAALFVVQSVISGRLVFGPLAALRDKSLQIATSVQHLGEHVPVPFGKELRDLGYAFNTMSTSLRRIRDELEDRVQERTADLDRANEQLRQDIVARERAEEELRREKEFAESLLETAQVIVLVLDNEGRTVSFNPYLEEISGYRLDEVKGKEWVSAFVPEYERERIQHLLARALTGTPTRGNINPIVTRDGGERQIEWNDRTLQDAEGNTIGILAIGQDITESLAAEETLKESEKKYRQLVELAQEGIWAIDAESNTTFVNPRMAEMLGYTPEEMAGRSLFHFMDERGVEIAKHDVERRKQGIREQHDFEFLRKDGKRIFVSLETSPLTDADGNYIGALAVVADISARVQAEEALRESEAKFRTLFNSASDGIFIHDMEGHFLEVNQRVCERLGYTREELLQMTLMDIDTPEFASRVPERMAELTRRGQVVFETAHRRRDGTVIPIEASVRIIEYRGAPAMLSIARDITERKRLEQQFLVAQKMDVVGRLAGGVAHEFNNMLTSVIGYAGFAKDALLPGDPVRDDIDQVLSVSERLADLTRRLLAFSRRQIIQPRPLNLNDLIANLAGMLDNLPGKNFERVNRLAPELGLVEADPGQIEQVLLNLAVNAIDAMPNGGTLTIETANIALSEDDIHGHGDMAPGEYVMLAVTDTGLGITEEVKAHLFEPFFTTKEVGQGTGLGLAAAYGIVKQHGGDIWVFSEAGHGARFEIYLPRLPLPS